MNIFDRAINMGDKLTHYFIPEYLRGFTIIDAGSNVGRFIDKIRSMNITNHISAIEPCLSNLTVLHQKKYDNVKIICGALVGYGVNKSVSFTEIEGLSEWGSVTDINTDRGLSKGRKNTRYEVDAIRLGDLVKEEIDYLKMDIEGNETDVILTLSPELAVKIRQISVEIHNGDQLVLSRKMGELGYYTKWYDKDGELFGIRKEAIES